jgi:hypothetical protein
MLKKALILFFTSLGFALAQTTNAPNDPLYETDQTMAIETLGMKEIMQMPKGARSPFAVLGHNDKGLDCKHPDVPNTLTFGPTSTWLAARISWEATSATIGCATARTWPASPRNAAMGSACAVCGMDLSLC